MKRKDFFAYPIIDAFKFFSGAYRPVYRAGMNSEHVLYLFHKVKRIARVAVHLINESENRYMAQRAHFKQFARLPLNAL